MAYGDYIHCKDCDCKLVYDGYHSIREALQSNFNIPNEAYTQALVCPDCQNGRESKALAAIEQARREAFEEAAQIAASYGAPVVPVVQRVTARDIAAAIRAREEGK